MIEAIFNVAPPGIVGMNRLAVFLNELKRTGGIADWQPMRALSASKGAKYAVQFADERDAGAAAAQWTASEKKSAAVVGQAAPI